MNMTSEEWFLCEANGAIIDTHYKYEYLCNNCLHRIYVAIRKGVKIEKIKVKVTCPNCCC